MGPSLRTVGYVALAATAVPPTSAVLGVMAAYQITRQPLDVSSIAPALLASVPQAVICLAAGVALMAFADIYEKLVE